MSSPKHIIKVNSITDNTVLSDVLGNINVDQKENKFVITYGTERKNICIVLAPTTKDLKDGPYCFGLKKVDKSSVGIALGEQTSMTCQFFTGLGLKIADKVKEMEGDDSIVTDGIYCGKDGESKPSLNIWLNKSYESGKIIATFYDINEVLIKEPFVEMEGSFNGAYCIALCGVNKSTKTGVEP